MQQLIYIISASVVSLVFLLLPSSFPMSSVYIILKKKKKKQIYIMG